MDIHLLVVLLPFIFMLHDFEEIVMYRPWLEKNRDEVKRRFPLIDKTLRDHHDQLSTSAFSVAVLQEFIIITLITLISFYSGSYQWWFGAFAAFSLHILIHLAQWLIYGKYVPFVLTSILALPYCIYTFWVFLKFTDMTAGQLVLWTAIGIGLTGISFIPAFFLASQFENWKNRSYLHER